MAERRNQQLTMLEMGMRRNVAPAAIAGVMLLVASAVAAQTTARASREQRDQRYQIGVMEGILEEAVEHGAKVTRDRLKAVLTQAEMLLSEHARARGFRLDGYGVFFDVVVPTLDGTLPWSFRLLDQNNLGLYTALNELRAFVEKSSDADLTQALKRIELQVAALVPDPTAAGPGSTPAVVSASASGGVGAGGASTAAASTAAASAAPRADPPSDPILNDPEAAYRAEIVAALMDAMLEHSRGLGLGPNEWLVVAAKRDEDRPRIAPIDTDAQTVLIRIRGGDLSAFLAGQLTREAARERMEVRVF
jgi:hypothetical protein